MVMIPKPIPDILFVDIPGIGIGIIPILILIPVSVSVFMSEQYRPGISIVIQVQYSIGCISGTLLGGFTF